MATACASDWLFVAAAGAPGAQPPLIAAGQCTPAALLLSGLTTPVTNADFEAVAFGDCALDTLP